MATERIVIVVSENGSRTVKRNLDDIGKSAGGADSAIKMLNNTLKIVGVGVLVREIGQLLDGYTNLQNRLGTVTTNTAQLASVTEDLFKISNQTRLSYEATAEVYARSANAAKNLGLSQQTMLQFTKSLNQAVVLSGASATEANAGLIQLSQGLASGTLRGDELRSVLEQLPAVADVIAEQMGVTRGQLRLLGQEGKITSEDIISAFLNASQQLDQRFGKTVPTISQSLTVLRNNVMQAFGAFDQANGISRGLASSILLLANNFQQLFDILTTIAALIITRVIVGLVNMTAATIASGVASVMAARQQAMLAAGMLGVGTAATGASVGVRLFGASMAFVGGPLGVFVLALWGIVEAVKAVTGENKLAMEVQDQYMERFRKFGDISSEYISASNERRKAIREETQELITELEKQLAAWRIAAEEFNKMSRLSRGLARAGGWLGLGPDVGAMEDTMANNAKLLAEIRKQESVFDDIDAGKGLGKGGSPDLNSRKITFEQIIGKLKEEAEALRLSSREREIANEMIRVEEQLKRKLTPVEAEMLDAQLRWNQALSEQAAQMDQIQAPLQNYTTQQQALKVLYDENRISLEQYNEAAAKAELNYLNSITPTNFADGFSVQLRRMQLETRNVAADMGKQLATVFGPGGTLSKGIGDAVAQSVVFGKSFKESVRGVAQSIVGELISSLVQIGVNMLLNAVLGETIMAATTAASVAAGTATAAAWAPAAAMASLASFGANSAPAMAGMGATVAMAKSLSMIGGFEEGGYTGNNGRKQIAGVVHGQEFVVNAAATARNRGVLEAMNSGRAIMPANDNSNGNQLQVYITNQIPDATFETRQIDENRVEVIARRIVREEAPGVIAADMRNPNSRTSKSLNQNTQTKRKRS